MFGAGNLSGKGEAQNTEPQDQSHHLLPVPTGEATEPALPDHLVLRRTGEQVRSTGENVAAAAQNIY